MITEAGRVVAVDSDSLWVETIQRSTCNSCAAEKGCGQSLIAKWGGHTSYLRVLLEGRNSEAFHIDDKVEIGIPEDVVVKGSLFVYLLPLLFLVLGAWCGQSVFHSDLAAIVGAASGLLLGGGVVKWRSVQTRNDRRLQPVLMGGGLSASIVVGAAVAGTAVDGAAEDDESPVKLVDAP